MTSERSRRKRAAVRTGRLGITEAVARAEALARIDYAGGYRTEVSAEHAPGVVRAYLRDAEGIPALDAPVTIAAAEAYRSTFRALLSPQVRPRGQSPRRPRDPLAGGSGCG